MSDIEKIADYISDGHGALYLGSFDEKKWHKDVLALIERQCSELEALKEAARLVREKGMHFRISGQDPTSFYKAWGKLRALIADCVEEKEVGGKE